MGRHIRTLIIAQNDLSRNGLMTLVNQAGSNIQVVGSYRNAEEGVLALIRLDAHVLLIDDTLPAAQDITAVLQRLHRGLPHLSIIVISGRLHARYLQRLFGAGAAGFIYREDRLEESLRAGIETVHDGHPYTSPRASGLLINTHPLEVTVRLNQSDMEVLCLIAQGLKPNDIAKALKLSVHSVYRIRRKLGDVVGAPTHEHLVAAAREKGLLDQCC